MKKLSPTELNRKKLLPKWIRFFCWVILIVSIFAFFILPTMITGGNISVTIFGFNHQGTGFDLLALLLLAIILFFGFSSFFLLRGKKWAIYLGIIVGILGILLPIIAMVMQIIFNPEYIPIPLELILFIPWTIKLFRVKKAWLSYSQTNNVQNKAV